MPIPRDGLNAQLVHLVKVNQTPAVKHASTVQRGHIRKHVAEQNALIVILVGMDSGQAHHLHTGAARALVGTFRALLAMQPVLHAHRVCSNFRRVLLVAPQEVSAPQGDSDLKLAVFDVQEGNSQVMMVWKLVTSATLVFTLPAAAKFHAEAAKVARTVSGKDIPVHTLLVLAAQ
jgi:hypothetical protein